DITEADEAYYRTDFDRATQAATPAPFEEARRAYYLGHLAASAYDGKGFADIEGELSHGWNNARAPGSWESVRSFAAVGYERGRDRRRTRPESDRRATPG